MIKKCSVSVARYLFLLIINLFFMSCGSFGEGVLMGLANYGSSLGYGNTYGYVGTSSSNNNDYLLDPNYTVAQTMSQYNQLNQVHETIAKQSIAQTFSQEEQDYQTFCKYNKKQDGTNYSKSEWRALQGSAIQKNNNAYSEPAISTVGESVADKSTIRKCKRISASDYAHCNDTGVCPMCNGAKRYYDTSIGISRWVDPCVVCGGSGDCPTCGKRK